MAYTAAKPASWFASDTLPLLAALCAHTETFELIEREFRGVDRLDTLIKLEWLDKMSRLRDRESKAMSSLATKLRLTHQSRYAPRAAATAAGQATGPRPWDPVNEFERFKVRNPRATRAGAPPRVPPDEGDK